MAKKKSDVKPVVGILGMILLAAGVYFLVWGFMTQTISSISWGSWNLNAVLLYLIGLFYLFLSF